jgi:hypothetical protein
LAFMLAGTTFSVSSVGSTTGGNRKTVILKVCSTLNRGRGYLYSSRMTG